MKKKLRFHPKKVTVLRSKCSSDDFAQMLAGIIVGRLKSDPTIAIFQDVSSAAGCGNHSAAGIDRKVHETLQFLSQFLHFSPIGQIYRTRRIQPGHHILGILKGAFEVVIYSSSKCG